MIERYDELRRLAEGAAAKHDWKQAERHILAAIDVAPHRDCLPVLEQLRERYRGLILMELGNWLQQLFARSRRPAEKEVEPI